MSDLERPNADFKELIEFVTRGLVDKPEQVDVRGVPGDRGTVYELRVAPEDLGKVIGKQGRTIRAIRTLVAATASKTDEHASLEVIE